MTRFEMFVKAFSLVQESNRLMRLELESNRVPDWRDGRDYQTIGVNVGMRGGRLNLFEKFAAPGDVVITGYPTAVYADVLPDVDIETVDRLAQMASAFPEESQLRNSKIYKHIWIDDSAGIYSRIPRDRVLQIFWHNTDQTFIEIG